MSSDDSSKLDGFANRIRAIRERIGKSQADFGELCGYSAAQVYNWEAGRSYPTLQGLIDICAGCEISAHWLLFGDGPMVPTGFGAKAVESMPLEDRLIVAQSLPVTILLGVIVESMQLWLASSMANVRRAKGDEASIDTEALRRLRHKTEVFERWVLATTELMNDIRGSESAPDGGRLIKTVGEESSRGSHHERTDRIYEVREDPAQVAKPSRGKKQKGG